MRNWWVALTALAAAAAVFFVGGDRGNEPWLLRALLFLAVALAVAILAAGRRPDRPGPGSPGNPTP